MADRQTGDAAGIYIHIPFCQSKCDYCAFVSYAARQDIFKNYLAALEQEIAFYADHPIVKKTSFNTLFIGGGTPTILPAERLAGLINTVQGSFALSPKSEISVECNPNTLEPDKLKALKSSGVNRLSIGAQSFNDRILNRIGRQHSAADVFAAVLLARESGFTNINLDLIYGLPGQLVHDLESDIKTALELKPEHLSIYQLSIDDNTPFADLDKQGKLDLPSEKMVAAMAEIPEQTLADKGYRRYEISNYALPDRECRHNLTYWHNGTYLGLGCAAVSSLSGNRIRNTPDPDHYIARISSSEPPWIESESLSKETSFRETVIMGLRLIDGIDINALRVRYGIDIHHYYKDTLDSLLSKELVRITNGQMRLSAKALPVANQILAELV